MTTSDAVQFLVWLLIAASVIAIVAARFRIPYTVALVLGGLALGSYNWPIVSQFFSPRPNWLTPDVTLTIFLPPLLFEGSLKIQARRLRANAVPILLLATFGVLIAALTTGYLVHWVLALPLWTALIFGAIIAATDPISVLAIFRDAGITSRLSVIVEGESLLNDGTAAVLFLILLDGFHSGHLGIGEGVREFFVESLGGAAVGMICGYIASKIIQRVDEPRIEITVTTVLAYGSYLAANNLHVSGVIAAVSAGLMTGNFTARVGMSAHTRIALWSFWEYLSFVINSIVFLLIGLEVHLHDLILAWRGTLLTVGAVLVGRALSIYGLIPISNRFAERISMRWQHVLVAGGIRGALALALGLSLPDDFPHRTEVLAMTFGVVAFTIVFQGFSIKPLIKLLGIVQQEDDEFARIRVRQIAASAAMAEVERLNRDHLISFPVYDRLHAEVQQRLDEGHREALSLYKDHNERIDREAHEARRHLAVAERSAIEQSMHSGLISASTAREMIGETDRLVGALDSGEQDESKLSSAPLEQAGPASSVNHE
jgi:CPA1 family monovalent cation:H+ antiporter